MPIKSEDGKSETISACLYCLKNYLEHLVEGEVIIIVKMNQTAREYQPLSTDCELEQGFPPHTCGNMAFYTLERGFPIQD